MVVVETTSFRVDDPFSVLWDGDDEKATLAVAISANALTATSWQKGCPRR